MITLLSSSSFIVVVVVVVLVPAVILLSPLSSSFLFSFLVIVVVAAAVVVVIVVVMVIVVSSLSSVAHLKSCMNKSDIPTYLQQKNCTVAIVDDVDFESEEEFQIHLADPLTEDGLPAQLGELDTVSVTITNHDDGRVTLSVSVQLLESRCPSLFDCHFGMEIFLNALISPERSGMDTTILACERVGVNGI